MAAIETRERLIRAAHDLFYEDGFHAVGLDRILRAAEVTKTTFYNHFKGKDDLVVEALRWHDRWWQETFRTMLRRHGGDRPRDQLLAAPDALAELFESDVYNGCIFINVAVHYPRPHDPAHELAAAHKATMEDILRELAGYAGASDALALAREISLVLEGAYVSRQVARRDEIVETARRLVTASVRRYVDEGRGNA